MHPKLDVAEQQQVCAAYAQGATSQSLADKWSVSRPTIHAYLHAASVQLRRPGRKSVGEPGRYKKERGYIEIPVKLGDPLYDAARQVAHYPTRRMLEHRYVMAVALGRPLAREETVHHINGNVADNRLENLQLRQGRHGPGVVHRCQACGSCDVVAEEIAD